MRKKVGIIKRNFATFLIIAMSINSFAAIVSDNDGSAFITKAEFDALKSSFQAQIDNYNQSIDSKIDGAISSYLSGIRINKAAEQQVFYAPSSGVTSVSTNEIKWQQGKMVLDFDCSIQRWKGGNVSFGNINFQIQQLDQSQPFNDCMVGDVWYNSGGSAEWKGMIENIQFYKCWFRSYREASNLNLGKGTGNDGTKNMYFNLSYGWRKLSNTDFSTSTATGGDLWMYIRTPGSSEAHSVPWEFTWTNNKAQITRTNNTTRYSNVILTPKSLTYKRFSNYDEIRDFCNDSDSAAHTGWTCFRDYNATASCTINTAELELVATTSTTKHYVEYKYTPVMHWETTRTWSNSSYQKWWPYIGFVSTLTDWNQLYTSTYDNYLNQIFEDATETKNIKTNKSRATGEMVDHLSLEAGYPVAVAKHDETIEWTFNFSDSGTHYVWLNEGCFSSGKNPKEENGLFTSFVSLSNATYDSTNKCLIVTDTNPVIVKVLKTNKRCLFAKWSKDVTPTGGGTLISNPTVTIVSPE